MPRQPLYNDGSAVRTQPGQEQGVSSGGARGVVLDEGAFMGAVQVPMLDDSGAIATGRGMAALGEGIASVGNAVMDYVREGAKARNFNLVNKAHIGQAQANAEMQAEIEREPDSSKWSLIAQRYLKERPQQWTNPTYPPDVKDEIEALNERWKTEVTGRVLTGAARKEIADRGNSLTAIYKTGVNEGKEDQIDAAADAMVKFGHKTKEEGEYLKSIGREEAERNRQRKADTARAQMLNLHRNDVVTAASSMPLAEVEKEIEALPDVDPTAKASLKNIAQAVARDNTASLAQTVADKIVTGEIWNEYELDATVGKHPALTPTLRKDFLDSIKKWDATKSREAKEGPQGVENFIRTYRAAMQWQPVQNSEESARDLARMIADVRATVPDDYAGEVTQLIHQKFGTKAPEMTVRDPIKRMVTKTISAKFKADLGPMEGALKQALAVDAAGTSETTKAAQDAYNKKEQEIIEDQTDIELQMEDFYRANPNPTQQQTMKELNRILPQGTLIRALEGLNDAPAPGAQGAIGPQGAAGASVKQFVDTPTLPEKLPAPLRPHSQDYIDAGREYGVDPRFLAAISIFETGGGTSSAFKNKNNAMGISNSKGPTAQESVRDSIFKMAKALTKSDGYYAKARTIDEIGAIYSPPGAGNDPHGTNSEWPSSVKAIYKNL
jgi:hypothetical protein